MRYFVFLILFNLCSFCSVSQNLIIKNIFIDGLKTTKENTLLRELNFQEGDTINLKDLESIIEENKSNLLNQWLFNFVEFNPIIQKKYIDILIKVTERWYIWPYPIFEIGERNFNVFWDTLRQSNFQNFSKLNYGVFLNWYNFRGKNELLKIKYRKGYKDHYLFEYDIPYVNRKKTWGVVMRAELFNMKEFYFKTINNQLIYTEINSNKFIDKKFALGIKFKPKINIVHTLEVKATNMKTDDKVDNINFLYDNQNKFNFLVFDYLFSQEKRDYKVYPLNGSLNEFHIEYFQGINNNFKNLSLSLKIDNHNKFLEKWSIGNSIKLKNNINKNLPYVLNNALGFEDYLRGYEYYVIDGGKYIISKSSIKHELIPMTEITLPGIPWKEFNKTHFSLYFSIFADMGFVEGDNYNNFLNNKFLFSQGISLDLVTYYDKILRLEISRNHLNEIGFFIHFSNPFGENIKAKQ